MFYHLVWSTWPIVFVNHALSPHGVRPESMGSPNWTPFCPLVRHFQLHTRGDRAYMEAEAGSQCEHQESPL